VVDLVGRKRRGLKLRFLVRVRRQPPDDDSKIATPHVQHADRRLAHGYITAFTVSAGVFAAAAVGQPVLAA
jgi:hypothetical protein